MLTQTATTLEGPFATVARYFSALDRFELEELLDTLSENVAYGHPQLKDWKPDLKVPVIHGREAVRAFMLEFRKKQDSHHRLTGYGKGVPYFGTEFVEGGDFYFVTVTGRNANYLASCCIVFEVDADNRISRYAPHVAPPAYNLQTTSDYLSKYIPAY